jgi:hypothetical protein
MRLVHPTIALTSLSEWLVAMEAMARDVAFVDLLAAILDEPEPSLYFAARQIERAPTPRYDAWLAETRRL